MSTISQASDLFLTVKPSAAAHMLMSKLDGARDYAVRIVATGREFAQAVCESLNAKTENAPEQRRAVYKALHQAASRFNASFTFGSRKHSGLFLADAKPASAEKPAGANTPKPKDITVQLLTEKLAAVTAERDALRAERDALRAELDALNASLDRKLVRAARKAEKAQAKAAA